jgi:hypothetical protein
MAAQLILYKDMLASRAVVVYDSRDDFLPSARIPRNDNRAVGGRHHLSLTDHVPKLAAFRYDFLLATSRARPTDGERFRRVHSDTRIHTSSLSVNKSSGSKRFGSLLLPEIHSRTKRAEQSLIIEGLGEERNSALCQRYFSYLVVCMS